MRMDSIQWNTYCEIGVGKSVPWIRMLIIKEEECNETKLELLSDGGYLQRVSYRNHSCSEMKIDKR